MPYAKGPPKIIGRPRLDLDVARARGQTDEPIGGEKFDFRVFDGLRIRATSYTDVVTAMRCADFSRTPDNELYREMVAIRVARHFNVRINTDADSGFVLDLVKCGLLGPTR